MCFFALLGAPGILGILTDAQLAINAALVGGGVVRRSGQIRTIQQTSSCVESKEWALVAKCLGTSE